MYKSKYKINNSYNNIFNNIQYKIDINSDTPKYILDENYYVLLTYGIRGVKINFVNVLLPSPGMEEPLKYYIDLKEKYLSSLHETAKIKNTQNEEKKITKLKKIVLEKNKSMINL